MDDLFSTTKTAEARDATSPVAGGLRDGALVAFLAAVGVRAVLHFTGDSELAGLAGAAVRDFATSPELYLTLGAMAGLATTARKTIQERLAK